MKGERDYLLIIGLMLLCIAFAIIAYQSFKTTAESMTALSYARNETSKDLYKTIGCKCYTNCLNECRFTCIGEVDNETER